METAENLKSYNCRNSFKRIFDFKGEIAPIAEKACRNFEVKAKNKVNREQRLHYFAIGHTFKHIDTERQFEKALNEELREKRPTRFLALQAFDRSFCDELEKIIIDKDNKKKYQGIIPDIRNINSHYVHDFQKIKLDTLSCRMISFIKESFELAITQTYLKEKEISYQQLVEQENVDKALVTFMHDKFYPLDDKGTNLPEEVQRSLDEYKAIRDNFKSLSKEDAIDSLLFVEVDNDFDWKLYGVHPVFKITTGKYLSFYACLFLLSMFLYKSEAEKLIGKIKGFKKQEKTEEKSKRRIFSFFSKKFSSQDIDSEENHLVKFRDLIQYLNHYPLAWNKELELESQHPAMTDKLKAKIIEMEINRSFPTYSNNERFHVFAKYQIWGKKYFGKSIEQEYIKQSFTEKEIEAFNYEIDASPELKDANEKLDKLKAVTGLYGAKNDRNTKEIKKTEGIINRITREKATNPVKEKLKNRIEKNLLFVSYGRNQDRFMNFAIRYLAETKYFGEDAQFKTYRFSSTEEQDDELLKLKETQSKKEYDKLKFHQGKPVHFTTFKDHLEHYESWDTPFVIENNAVQVKLTFATGIKKIVSVQRGLMVYFLEDALTKESDKIENAGKSLLEDYYAFHQKEFSQCKSVLEQSSSISSKEKTIFKKLLPKRLLYHYSPAVQNGKPQNTLSLLLERATNAEKRYDDLLTKAKAEGNFDDFVKRNKGKQFKLQFVRKAWHLMFFKESYMQQAAFSGHHKRFHIAKDEFNDFSRFMFAFDEVPHYKAYLTEMLEKKGFFDNPGFKTLFRDGVSLDDLYLKTKKAYEAWLSEQDIRVQEEDKYALGNYEHFFGDEMFYINISHFINYLDAKSRLKRDEQGLMKFTALENVKFLIPEYYYTDKLEKAEYKTCGKLYNKLKSSKLEDALLFEMAMRYLKIDKQIVQKAKSHATEILKQDVEFDIRDLNSNHLYHLMVPFNKIESYIGLIKLKEEQEESKFKTSFLANIVSYIELVKEKKEIKGIYKTFSTNPAKRVLTFDELNKIDGHLISSSVKFTKLALTLEQYYVSERMLSIIADHRIEYDEIKDLKKYYNTKTRNKAFHFGVPENSYDNIISKIEQEFVRNEIKSTQSHKFEELSKPLKSICSLFMDTIHNNYFDPRERDGKKKHKDAEQKYFDTVISK